MKLSCEGLKDTKSWKAAEIVLPKFDIAAMRRQTRAFPTWVHVGAGNIFRAFLGRAAQTLLNERKMDSGIVAVSTHNAALVEQIYKPYDELSLLVGLRADGTMSREVIASVADSLIADGSHPEDRQRLKEIFCSPSLQMVSFTITEKGYALKDLAGEWLPAVKADFEAGPERCTHAMSLTAALLYTRFCSCKKPLAVVSMDNCSHNGEKLRSSVLTVARQWNRRGYVEEAFLSWLEDENQVSFPWSMIDKITPRPARAVAQALIDCGLEGMQLKETAPGKQDAAFVNAEIPEYLVLEDRFPNGRPPLEEAGIYMTDRETVNKTEKMKVTTCLNPLHTALAVFGCLLGQKTIAAEMQDPDLKELATRIGCREGLPVAVHPGIIAPEDFLNEVLTQRLPNPFMPDQPQRIATDTSQKVGVRFGETIKSYVASDCFRVADLTCIPLAIAAWLRYLLAVDDAGMPMSCSSDPMLEALQQQLAGTVLGNPDSAAGKLNAILSNTSLFGVDLVQAGLAEKIETMFRKMLVGPGAVRRTLQEYVN